jgi:hypothetical protein
MIAEVQRFPLAWPAGWARTKHRAAAKFVHFRARITADVALKRLEGELRRIGATHETLSTNLELKFSGGPRFDRPPLGGDPGVAVYFVLKSKPIVLACDRWDRVADNIAAVAAHIDALRRIDRYGVGTLEQAFAGYAALPPSAEDWALVLGLPKTATRAEVLAAHRKLASDHHPDRGGRDVDMARINAARDVALKSVPA